MFNGDGKGKKVLVNRRKLMATSSIRKNFVIEGEEMAQKFVDAIDWSMAHREPIKSNMILQEPTEEEFKELNRKWEENYGKKY